MTLKIYSSVTQSGAPEF